MHVRSVFRLFVCKFTVYCAFDLAGLLQDLGLFNWEGYRRDIVSTILCRIEDLDGAGFLTVVPALFSDFLKLCGYQTLESISEMGLTLSNSCWL
jgi:hypothetical protein